MTRGEINKRVVRQSIHLGRYIAHLHFRTFFLIMLQLPLAVHYIKPRLLVIESVLPTSHLDETQQTICQQVTAGNLPSWHEMIEASSIIIGRGKFYIALCL